MSKGNDGLMWPLALGLLVVVGLLWLLMLPFNVMAERGGSEE